MGPTVTELFRSPIGRVVDFGCHATEPGTSGVEYSPHASVSFVRRGEFEYRIGGREYPVYPGLVFLEAPGVEYRVRHPHAVPDACTNFEFDGAFVAGAGERALSPHVGARFARAGVVVAPSSGRLDYLHARALESAGAGAPALAVDAALVDLFEATWCSGSLAEPAATTRAERERHLEAIDRAKRFVLGNFQQDLSLDAIARSAFVSAFHFSRLFKRFTARSPYQYLLDVRLGHAALLLRNTSRSVTDVCFDSGFNAFEHFVTTFTRRFGASPSRYRRGRENSKNP